MAKKKLRCPSSYPDGIDTTVFAVVVGGATNPEVKYLKEPVEVTEELLASTAPVLPTEVFRFSSECMEEKCGNFNLDTQKCKLGERNIKFIKPASNKLFACAIRKTCVWWNQQGKAACIRCSSLVRDGYPLTEDNVRASTPPSFLNNTTKLS